MCAGFGNAFCPTPGKVLGRPWQVATRTRLKGNEGRRLAKGSPLGRGDASSVSAPILAGRAESRGLGHTLIAQRGSGGSHLMGSIKGLLCAL